MSEIALHALERVALADRRWTAPIGSRAQQQRVGIARALARTSGHPRRRAGRDLDPRRRASCWTTFAGRARARHRRCYAICTRSHTRPSSADRIVGIGAAELCSRAQPAQSMMRLLPNLPRAYLSARAARRRARRPDRSGNAAMSRMRLLLGALGAPAGILKWILAASRPSRARLECPRRQPQRRRLVHGLPWYSI